jgi:hypothetical protein
MSMINPLLQAQEPTYIEVELPSKGIPYKIMGNTLEIFEEGAIENGKVQIRPLTTRDELIWTDEKLVKDLKAPIIILKNTLLGIKKPELLLKADVEFLLLQSRILTYGEYTKISWVCSECGKENETYIDFNTLPIKKLNNESDLILTFKNYEILMTPIIFKEAVEIQKANDNEITEQLDRIVSCIQNVKVTTNDGNIQIVKEKQFIAQWVEQLNPKYFKLIIDFFTKVNEIGTLQELDVKCKFCGFEEKTDVIVDITTFLSEEELETLPQKN